MVQYGFCFSDDRAADRTGGVALKPVLDARVAERVSARRQQVGLGGHVLADGTA